MSEERALVPVDERTVDFYGDTLTAALIQEDSQDVIYVPIRPLSDYLGLNWSGQQQRVRRDPVLSEVARIVCITHTNPQGGNPNVLCLPLKFINGWLFGVNPGRVREELREKIVRYQRECYDILASAFLDRAHTAVSPAVTALMQIREIGLAIAQMAQQQIELEQRMTTTESRLDRAAVFVGELSRRVSSLETRLAPGNPITDEQAAEIAQRVKALAMLLTEKDNSKNHYQGIFSELHRRFGVTSYKLISQSKFTAVLDFLEAWRRAAGDSNA